jgi:hypothetical protein
VATLHINVKLAFIPPLKGVGIPARLLLKNTGMKLMKKDVAKIVTVATIIALLLLVQAPISAL